MTSGSPSEPDASTLAEAALLLRLSARPVILAGAGALLSGAGAELAALAGRLGAPVITTWNAKGIISDEHPLAAGAMAGQPEGASMLADSDMVLALGTSFGFAPEEAQMQLPSQMIQVDIDPEQLGRRFPVRLGIAGDAEAVLQGILKALESPSPLKSLPAEPEPLAALERPWALRASGVRRNALARAHRQGADQMAALEGIRHAVARRALILHDYGESAQWFAPFFIIEEPGSWRFTGGGAGSPVSEAVEAAKSSPDRPVVAFSHYSRIAGHAEVVQKLAGYTGCLTLVVFADEPGGAPSGPDLVEVARSAGLAAARVSGHEELAAALSKAAASGSPSVIEAACDWSPPARTPAP